MNYADFLLADKDLKRFKKLNFSDGSDQKWVSLSILWESKIDCVLE